MPHPFLLFVTRPQTLTCVGVLACFSQFTVRKPTLYLSQSACQQLECIVKRAIASVLGCSLDYFFEDVIKHTRILHPSFAICLMMSAKNHCLMFYVFKCSDKKTTKGKQVFFCLKWLAMHSDMDTKYHVISIVFAVGLHSTRPWVSGLCNSRVTRDYLVTYRVNKANGNQYPRFNIDPHCSNNTMSPTEPGKKNVSKKRIAKKKSLFFFYIICMCARTYRGTGDWNRVQHRL